ncbi:MAG: hypothetical protein CMI67_04625 [Pelagibaca sp.]|nr:hypothetical protein [Pelagibaca sp.]
MSVARGRVCWVYDLHCWKVLRDYAVAGWGETIGRRVFGAVRIDAERPDGGDHADRPGGDDGCVAVRTDRCRPIIEHAKLLT